MHKRPILLLPVLLLLWPALACSLIGPAEQPATAGSQDALATAVDLPSATPSIPGGSPWPPVEGSTACPTERPTSRPAENATLQPTPSSLLVSETVQPTNSPAPMPTPTPTDLPPVGPALCPPAVWEQDIVLDTYGWQQALVPTGPEDPIYPYPRLNFDTLTGPAPQTYRAVYVQNAYLQLVILPELGGRILRWTDRTTGRQLFYANPVIKPTRWGYRGWWLATGGMEWAFPVEEHGLNEYRPWQVELLWNGVRVWDVDDYTGMTVEVTIRVDEAHNYFSVTPSITNGTGETQSYQFWANAMLTLGDQNVPSPDLIFVLPDDAVTVHSTGDGGLPAPGGQMTWPVYNGRDFSRYNEWHQYLGVFADPAQAGFVGAYDLASDQGVVRVFPPATATGVKLFCMGDLSSSLWTDDGSRYFELWGGVTPTFWDEWTLEPGGRVTWTERWYAVSGTGGFNWANEEAAIRLVPGGDSAEVAVATTRAMGGTVVLRRGGLEVQRWDEAIAPGVPFRAVSEATSAGGEWGVQLLVDGMVVAQVGP